MKSITISEVEYVAFRLAKEHMLWDEPIPDFGSRFPNILESCLASPFQSFGGKKLYKGLLEKASVLFYLMVKNHPFKNGNKRIAMTTLLYFLYKNKKWIKVDNQELYNFAKWVAASNPKLRRETIAAINKFLSTYLQNFMIK
ncbi:MAG: type II toxin-antitoxin system death-on-curing family toxin [Candidatus Harrisonbacteria bacterium]|nr:type II toxin-antitoxin system death-on-curing family toxin [Candidatus Harrisonbacteria bacterium]